MAWDTYKCILYVDIYNNIYCISFPLLYIHALSVGFCMVKLMWRIIHHWSCLLHPILHFGNIATSAIPKWEINSVALFKICNYYDIFSMPLQPCHTSTLHKALLYLILSGIFFSTLIQESSYSFWSFDLSIHINPSEKQFNSIFTHLCSFVLYCSNSTL